MQVKEVFSKRFIKVDKSEKVSSLMGKLLLSGDSTAFIFDKNKFLGITTLRKIIKTRARISNVRINKIIWHVPEIYLDDDLVDVATLMYHSGARVLPVVDKGKIIGAVYASRIINKIKDFKELKKLRVRDIRHPTTIIVDERDRIGKAFEIMYEEHINRLPVVFNDKLTGVITLPNIIQRFLRYPTNKERRHKSGVITPGMFDPNERDALALPVDSFATHANLVTVSEKAKLAKVVNLMISNQISDVIVVKGKEPVSIVTVTDLLEAIMNTKRAPIVNIQFIGLKKLEKDLDPYTYDYVQKLASFYAEKIAYLIKNINMITVTFKKYGKGGKRAKFSVHVRVAAPTTVFTSTKAADWDIARTVHKSFKNVEREILHRFHKEAHDLRRTRFLR
jgi:CBS domain-containing protein